MSRGVVAGIVLGSWLAVLAGCTLAQLDARYGDDASTGASSGTSEAGGRPVDGPDASPDADVDADACPPGTVCFVGIASLDSDAGVIAVGAPPGARAGDLLVLVLFEDNVDAGDAAPFATTGAGWVTDAELVPSELDANARFHAFFDGGLDASFTFTSLYSTPCHAVVAAYRGVSPEDGGVGRPYVDAQTGGTTRGDGLITFALPTPARLAPGALLVFGLADSQAGTWMSTSVTVRGGDEADAGAYFPDAHHIVIADVASSDGGALSVVRGGGTAQLDVVSLVLSP